MIDKHTPGPWEVKRDGFGYFDILASNGGIGIAFASHQHGGDAVTGANARLIAAAPDLLSLVKEACDLFKKGGPIVLRKAMMLDPSVSELVVRLDRAIKQVEDE